MKISNGVNKKISFPIAVIIIVVLSVIVGGEVLVWQHWFILEEVTRVSEVKPSEKGTASKESKNCVNDNDCVFLGINTDCNCGCFNKNFQWQSSGKCSSFCPTPTSCACIQGKCEPAAPQGSLGEVSMVDLNEWFQGGKNKVKLGDIIIEKIAPDMGSESIRLEMPEEDILVYKIDDKIKVMTPDYRSERSSRKFSMGYIVSYENKEVYREVELTALDVYKLAYKDKEYFAVETGRAGTGGYFSSLSIFIINREGKEVKLLDTISGDGSLDNILNQIYRLI